MNTNTTRRNIVGEDRRARSFTRFLPATARVLMGAPLLVFGLNGFLNFFPPPPPLPEGATAFLSALMQTGYMTQLIAVTHLTVGVLLLANRFVPLAIALFAPFIVNSIAFHAVLERSGLPMAIGFLVLEVYLAWKYREAYRPMLKARASVR